MEGSADSGKLLSAIGSDDVNPQTLDGDVIKATLESHGHKPASVGKAAPGEIRHMIDTNAKIELRQENPKKVGSKSHARYEKYKTATTVQQLLSLTSRADLVNDYERGYIKLRGEAPDKEEVVASEVAKLSAVVADVAQRDAQAQQSSIPSNYRDQWLFAMKAGSHTTTKAQSFSQLCKSVQVPTLFQGVYHKWLLKASDGILAKKDIGDLQLRARVNSGVTVPFPAGSLWLEMVTEHTEKEAPSQDFI